MPPPTTTRRSVPIVPSIDINPSALNAASIGQFAAAPAPAVPAAPAVPVAAAPAPAPEAPAGGQVVVPNFTPGIQPIPVQPQSPNLLERPDVQAAIAAAAIALLNNRGLGGALAAGAAAGGQQAVLQQQQDEQRRKLEQAAIDRENALKQQRFADMISAANLAVSQGKLAAAQGAAGVPAPLGQAVKGTVIPQGLDLESVTGGGAFSFDLANKTSELFGGPPADAKQIRDVQALIAFGINAKNVLVRPVNEFGTRGIISQEQLNQLLPTPNSPYTNVTEAVADFRSLRGLTEQVINNIQQQLPVTQTGATKDKLVGKLLRAQSLLTDIQTALNGTGFTDKLTAEQISRFTPEDVQVFKANANKFPDLIDSLSPEAKSAFQQRLDQLGFNG